MTVNICGLPYKVIECDDSFDTDIHFGMIDYTKLEIRINKKMPDIKKEETLCHEIVHGMLLHLGYPDLCNDEHFVQVLGNAINHSFEVRKDQKLDDN